MLVMLARAFFSWWYGEGWKTVATSFRTRYVNVASTFSVNQLLRTLFAPWRRIITYPGASLNDKMKAWSDNLFSRSIGFVVRLLVLLAAFIAILVVMLLSVIEFVLWPLLPPAIIVCPILGVVL